MTGATTEIRKLSEADARAWIRTAGNRSFRYKVNYQGLTFLSLLGAVMLALSLIMFVQSEISKEKALAAVCVMAGINIWAWVRVMVTIVFAARHFVGLSSTELLIAQGYKVHVIPLSAIREESLGLGDESRRRTVNELPIHVDGRTFHVKLVSPYYSLEHLPLFIGTLLEHVHDRAPSAT